MVIAESDKLYFSNSETVAVAPLPPPEPENQLAKMANRGSVASLMTRNEDLKPLTVLFHSNEMGLSPGDTIFLRPEAYEGHHMVRVYQLNGIKFLLIPKDAIITMLKGTSW